jgi:acetyl esterase/lipase
MQAAVLYYGVYDLGIRPGARLAKDEDHPDLSTSSIRRMIQWFTPGLQPEQRQVAAISPLYAPVPRLPETLFLVGGADILVDDTLGLAQRWAQKNTVRVALFPGAPHGFNMFELDGVDDSVALVCDFFAQTLG